MITIIDTDEKMTEAGVWVCLLLAVALDVEVAYKTKWRSLKMIATELPPCSERRLFTGCLFSRTCTFIQSLNGQKEIARKLDASGKREA